MLTGYTSHTRREEEYKATMIGLQKYMTNKANIQIQAVHWYQNSKTLHSVPKGAETYLHEAGTVDDVNSDHSKALHV